MSEQTLKILVVEDETTLRIAIARKLEAYGSVRAVSSATAAKEALREQFFDVAFIDLNLNDGENGICVIEAAVSATTCPIVLTGYEDQDKIKAAYSAGCEHYFAKRDFLKDPNLVVGAYLRGLAGNKVVDFLRNEFLTNDQSLQRRLEWLGTQSYAMDQRILILGPTGVGKSKVAKLIHRLANLPDENFVHLNVGEFSENLLESTLFGHKKGAFTGATESSNGLLFQANNGTLFLDEIGAASLSFQRKLLKVLDDQKYTPVGASKPIQIEFRLITATCDDLTELAQRKLFRSDFYFRIRGMELNIPPLRDRRADIPLLMKHFFARSVRKIALSPEAEQTLRAYDWPGNVRELESVVNELSMTNKGLIDVHHLPVHIVQNRNPLQQNRTINGIEIDRSDEKLYTRTISRYIRKYGLRKFFAEVEKEAFAEILEQNSGNLTKTQKTLGVSKSALYRIQAARNEDFDRRSLYA